jgi:hypothetical protein
LDPAVSARRGWRSKPRTVVLDFADGAHLVSLASG